MTHGKKTSGRRPPTKLGAKPKASSRKEKFDFVATPRPERPIIDNGEPKARLHQRLGEFTVDRLGHDGRGISTWEKKTLFIDGALVGERVSARFVAGHAKYNEAVVDQVIEAAPERVVPPCPHYQRCGGCQLQHMASSEQVRVKQQAALEQMQRWAGVSPQTLLAPVVGQSEGYRARARLGVWYETDGTITLGFRRRQSKSLVDIDRCLVLPDTLNRLLAPIKQWLATHSARAVTHVELVQGEQAAPVILMRHTRVPGERDFIGLRTLAEQTGAAIYLEREAGELVDLQGQTVDPRLFYSLQQGALKLYHHPKDFIQVNPEVNQKMVAQALQLLALNGSERVLDLFCGIGNFSLPLAAQAKEVIGVEAIDSMVVRGRENAQNQGINNVRFMAADLTKISVHQLQQRCGQVDAILLDPPREGAKEIVASIGQLAAKRIVYVSCNPATLARDAKTLVDSGYQLASFGILDMFPHTAHVESMALFVLKKK